MNQDFQDQAKMNDALHNEMESQARFFLVQTTVPDQQTAERVAGDLVSSKLAACVQIDGPLTSVYRWNAKLETAQEYRLCLKTVLGKVQQVVSYIQSIHPYDLPEIICLPIIFGSREYLDWIARETA